MASSKVQFPWPSTMNVANFISTKLWFDYEKGDTNYKDWREQMLCLIEGQDLLGFIDGSIPPPESASTAAAGANDYLQWRRSDRLLKGWILGSLSNNLISEVSSPEYSSIEVWSHLNNIFFQLVQRQQQNNNVENNNIHQEKDYMEHVPLHKAVLDGDWETAKIIFDRDPRARCAALNILGVTPLQTAVGTGNKSIHFVRKLVEMMGPADEEISQTDSAGNTALHVASAVGNTLAATILVNRMPRLLYIKSDGNFPVVEAASNAKKGTLQYLISVTKEEEVYQGIDGLLLLIEVINAEFFDVALNLVGSYPHLAKLSLRNGESALSTVASNKSVFSGGSSRFWDRFMISYRDGVMSSKLQNEKMNQQARTDLVELLCSNMESMSYSEATTISIGAMINAAKLGIHDVVEMIVKAFPSSIYTSDLKSGQLIFHVAVLNRSECVFNLIYQMSDYKSAYLDEVDNNGDNLLHAAGKLAPSHKLNKISGAALQMQREMQWFKEVKKFVNPNSKRRLNKEGKSPEMLFTEEHKGLKEEGEKWMKDTANSCTIAAALIVTMVFAAAITVPGGNASDTGLPVFSRDGVFVVFAVSDAISLFASTTSLLMFLSILTSRYAEEDFLCNLPKRLILGLGTLFLSITFMMVAFSATLYLVFGQKKAWVLIPVAVMACLPVTSFVLLQFPLLVDLVSFTYGRGIFGKQSNRPFY